MMCHESFFVKVPDHTEKLPPIYLFPLTFLQIAPTPRELQIKKKGNIKVYSIHLTGGFQLKGL
jgi:hypothetical protein